MAEVIMTFNGESRPYVQVLHGLERSAFAPVTRELLEVPGFAGAYLTGTRTGVREITVPIKIKGDDYSDLQSLKEDIAEWLVHDEPKELTFSDEPNRTYYAVIEGSLNTEDIIDHGKGEVKFLCPDPYKYGDEVSVDFDDSTTITNNGTAETKPVFELEVKENTTFAMVQRGVDDYMMIGVPLDATEEAVENRSLRIDEDGSTISTWQQAPGEIYAAEATKSGSLGYNGAAITPISYGTGTKFHGPRVVTEIPLTMDFEVEMRGTLVSGTHQVGRFGFHVLDDQLRHIGMMSAIDITENALNKQAEGRVGPYVGLHRNYPISSSNFKHPWGDFNAYLRLKRIGNTFEFYVARVRPDGTHVNALRKLYTTTNELYLGPLKYISIFFDAVGTRYLPPVNRIDSVKVWGLAQTVEDQTPYIAYPGDVITFNHGSKSILINGINRTDLKDFGAQYFSLNKGANTISLYPPDTFDANVSYKERFK